MPKRLNPQLISSFVILVVTGILLIACAFTFTFTFAWFSHNKEVSARGMQVSVADKRIELADTITVTRTLGQQVTTQTYRCEGDNDYYLYENGAFLTDEQGNRMPFHIPELLPGELVDVTFGYRCTDSLIGACISASLTEISSDTFAEIDHPDVLHSVLGVYRLSVKQGEEFSQGDWLVEYASGVAEIVPEKLPVFTDVVWSKVSDVEEENFVWTTFRFEFDLEQYGVLKTTTNLLSEKSFWIGALRIEVTDDE